VQRTNESPLFESVREWVLRSLPVDRTNANLVAHLEAKDAHDLLVIYHNWMSRTISAEPRTVHRSSALDSNTLAHQYQVELCAISTDIETGSPLAKYLSRGIKVAASLPGTSPSLQRRPDLDLMLNAWGIYHLHLSTSVEADGFVSRTGPLLFAAFRPGNAYLIDIMEHGSWTSKKLIEVVVSEFQDSSVFVTLEGVVGLSCELDEHGRQTLRKGGVNFPVMINGKAVMPTAGMVSTGTTVAATRESDRLLMAIEGFERAWVDRPHQVRTDVAASGRELPDTPDFAFEIHETAGAGIAERKSMIFFPLFRS